MNKVILMGRLTQDAELKQTPSGVNVTTFTVAVNRRFAKEGQQQTDFIRCTAWRQQAEFICKYFKKGSMICVEGELRTESFNDKEGKKQYITEVLLEKTYFTGEKREEKENFSQIPDWGDFSQESAGEDEGGFPWGG